MAVVVIDVPRVLLLTPRVFRSGVIDFRIIVPEERKVSVELFDAKMKQALVSEIIFPQDAQIEEWIWIAGVLCAMSGSPLGRIFRAAHEFRGRESHRLGRPHHVVTQ